MASSNLEVDNEFLPFLRVYKGGKVERFFMQDEVPASIDTQTGVSSKDVIINPQTSLSARLYLPQTITSTQSEKKLPLLIYFHGGCFVVGSAFSPIYHQFMNSLVAEANVIALSVEYRLAPEHPLPAAYEDSWEAIKWVVSHFKGEGTESWLTNYVDFNRVFLSGESAGANITHNLAMKLGEESNNLGNTDFKVLGVALIQPFFWGKERIGVEKLDPERNAVTERTWSFAYPSSDLGNDDPRINPIAVGAPSLSGLGCRRVIVFIAEKDLLKDREYLYCEALEKSGWDGKLEILETKDKDHVFHLFAPNLEESVELLKRLALFLNQ